MPQGTGKFFKQTVLLLLAAPAFAATWLAPSITNATTNGLSKTTELRIVNQGTSVAQVNLQVLLASGQTSPAPVSVAVQPHAGFFTADVLGGLFGLHETSAALQIATAQPLSISAEAVATNSAGVSLRSALPVVADTDLIRTNEGGHLLWVAQSTSRTSSLTVAFLDPQNSAQLTIYDAAGKQVAQQTFSGGPQFKLIPLSGLLTKDLPLGSALLSVTSGKAGCSLLLADSVSGDVIATKPERYFEGPTDVLIPGVARSVQDSGQIARTDLRLYNFGSTPAAVRVSATAVTGDGNAPAGTITVPASGMTEIVDVFAATLGAPGNALGVLRLQSDQSVAIAARYALGMPDGSNGTLGDALPVRTALDFVPAGGMLELAGVRASSQIPGASSLLAFAAGGTGATADVTALDNNGQIVAQIPGALQLDPNGYVEIGLADLFGDSTLPAEVTLDVQVDTGTLAAHQSIVDNATADVAVESAAFLGAYTCLPPAILDFSAAPSAIVAAGPVNLFWSADADYVQLNPGNLTLEAEGSQSVDVPAAGVTYTLDAFNVCGSVRRPLSVLPATSTGTLSVTPAAAQSGQLLTIHFGQRDLTGLQGVEFENGGVLQTVAAVQQITDSGDVQVTVPAIPDPSKPGGLLSGSFILRPSFAGMAGLTGPNFTLQALTYTGDAISEFRQIVAYLAAQAHTNLDAITAVYSNPSALADAPGMIDRYAQILNQAADDLAAKGTAAVPVDLPTPEYPTPDTNTITVADLQNYLAYLHAISGTNPLVPPSGAKRVAPRADLKGGACIKDQDPLYKACLTSTLNPLGPIGDSALGGIVKFIGGLIDKFSSYAQYACWLAPLAIQSFRVQTDSILAGRTEDKQVIGMFGPYANKSQLQDSIIQKNKESYVKSTYIADFKKYGQAKADQNYNAYVAVLKKQAQSIVDEAAKLAGGDSAERTAGKCELTDVQPEATFRRNLQRKAAEESAPQQYRFQGKKNGQGHVAIFIDPSEFVDFNRQGRPARIAGQQFLVDFTVGKPSRQLVISDLWETDGVTKHSAGGLPVTIHDNQKYQNTVTLFGNVYRVNVTPIEPGVWRVDLTVTRNDGGTPGAPRGGLQFSAVRGSYENNAQEIEVDLSSSGTAPQLGNLNPPPATATITASVSANSKSTCSNKSLSVSATNGGSVSKTAGNCYGVGATNANVNISVEGRGFSPNITVSALVKMEDDQQ